MRRRKIKSMTLLQKGKAAIEIKKGMQNSSKLASRKLWVTVGGSLLASVLTVVLLTMGVSEDLVEGIVGWIAKIILGYAGAQGAVDIANSFKRGKEIYNETTRYNKES